MNLVKIGEIETPYKTLEECPSNVSKNGPLCTLRIDSEYQSGLLGLKDNQKILVLYWFEHSKRDVLIQKNVHKANGEELGSFALRSPFRPNPIAASEVVIEKVEDGNIFVKGFDCLSGTTILDIKPC